MNKNKLPRFPYPPQSPNPDILKGIANDITIYQWLDTLKYNLYLKICDVVTDEERKTIVDNINYINYMYDKLEKMKTLDS